MHSITLILIFVAVCIVPNIFGMKRNAPNTAANIQMLSTNVRCATKSFQTARFCTHTHCKRITTKDGKQKLRLVVRFAQRNS